MSISDAKKLYDHISEQYHKNRNKASNDVTELPAVLNLLGDINNKSILDLGCGTGKHAKAFLEKNAKVTGYDISEKMINICREYCQNKGNFFIASHEDVDFNQNSFDICNASFTLNYVENLDNIFFKIKKWLKPNGIFTFSIPHPIWLLQRSFNMDYSYPHKIDIEMKSYGVKIFTHYKPLNEYIKLFNQYNLKLLNIVETTIPKNIKGWPEPKYRLPNAFLFKLTKN